MDADQVLAFRLARSGLAAREARSLAEAAACPASDFQRDAALLALAARAAGVTREGYEQAIDGGDLVLAHIVRGAIHALDPEDHARYGRALLATDDDELGMQLGQQVRRLADEHGFRPTEALAEVAAAIEDALGDGSALDKNELHQAMRERVRAELMPWCRTCQSHHVAPMLWRFATVQAGARLDAQRRYVLPRNDGAAPAGTEALRRFLRFYGPSTAGEFAEWAGLARPHARRLWEDVEPDLVEVRVGKAKAWLLADDEQELNDPPQAEGLRLLPPSDPYLQKPNRPLLAPEAELRKRLFRPVASPGVVLRDGRLAGTWKSKAKGRGRTEVVVEPLARKLPKDELEHEAERIAALRGAPQATVVLAG